LSRLEKTGRIINIKKPQFVSPADMKNAVEKVASTGNTRIYFDGTRSSFGYQNLRGGFSRNSAKEESRDTPSSLDATPFCSIAGGQGHASGGQPNSLNRSRARQSPRE